MAIYNPDDAKIEGLRLSIDSAGANIFCTPGNAYLPGTYSMLNQTTLSTPVPTMTSAWIFMYLGVDSSSSPILIASTIAPDLAYYGTARTMTGDLSKRFLGSLYVTASGNIAAFLHSQPGDRANRVDFTPVGGASLSTANLLTLGVDTTAKNLPASSLVPPVCRVMYCLIQNTSVVATAYLSTPDYGTVSATNYLRSIPPGLGGEYQILLNGNQQLSYVLAGGVITTGGLNIKVCGYLFDR